ncbi:hypothetical protein H9P43_005223 [Blastocladiella emersonii ATCC 22665]|nr:hypothetical protein H9P43_005223 [Blastocladiella emersonii ATCC 22665]
MLRYSAKALLGAARNNHYGVLDWWRDSGLPLPPYNGELQATEFRVVAGVVGARAIAEMVELRILPDNFVEPGDEYINRNLAAITAGQFDYLSIKGGRLTASGIEALNGALSHNCQALRGFHFDPCNLSIDAVRSITLPPSANVTTFDFEALRHDLPCGAPDASPGHSLPDSVTALTFKNSCVDQHSDAAFGSLFPAGLEVLRFLDYDFSELVESTTLFTYLPASLYDLYFSGCIFTAHTESDNLPKAV